MLTTSRLKELLSYDKDTGVFMWLKSRGGAKKGMVAGCIDSDGYVQIGLDGKLYRAHRVAFLYVFDRWPSEEIDHINGDRTDNRIKNLRESTRAENMQNLKKPSVPGKSGLFGAQWSSAKRKWRAAIKTKGFRKHLGYFDTPEEARNAYILEKKKTHPFFNETREHLELRGSDSECAG
jgi:hypothetical protein